MPDFATMRNDELSDSIIDSLNRLVEINLDSTIGYQTAAGAMQNPDYGAMLRQYADDRRRFVGELSKLVQPYAELPEKSRTFPSIPQHDWRNLNSVLTDGDRAILDECEQADEIAVAAYQDVIAKVAPEPVLELLRQQFTDIRNAYERVRALSAALVQAESHR
jgi:uncharacterized protein (TIGR02284 family)